MISINAKITFVGGRRALKNLSDAKPNARAPRIPAMVLTEITPSACISV